MSTPEITAPEMTTATMTPAEMGEIPEDKAQKINWLQLLKTYHLLAAVFVLFCATYSTTFVFLARRWTLDPSAQHGWLVIPIAGTVVYFLRKRLAALPVAGDGRGFYVMAFALFMHLFERAVDLNGPSPLSIPIFVAGAVWYFVGTAWLRVLAFPIAYLLFMVPIPGGFTEVVSFPLRLLATVGAKKIATLCAIPIALAANLTRIVGIILLSAYVNRELGLKLWHDYSSPLLFAIAFIILISIGRFMEWATGALKAEKQAS